MVDDSRWSLEDMIETATMNCGPIVQWGLDDEIAVVMVLIVLVWFICVV